MSEPSNNAKRLLTPTATYRKMVVVSISGAILLALLGIAASSRQAPVDLEQGYELLALATGTVKEVHVKAGQFVEKGDLLLLLEDSAEIAEVEAARAELEAIAQENQTAGIAVAMPPAPEGLGGRIVPIGPIWSRNPSASPLRKATGDSKVGTLPPAAGGAMSTAPGGNGGELEATLGVLESDLQSAQATILNSKQKVEDVTAQIGEAERNSSASKVIADQRKKQAEKMRSLLREGVVSQVETSRSEALYASAQGGYEASVRQVEDLKAEVAITTSEIQKTELTAASLTKEIERTKEALAKVASAPTPAAMPPNALPLPEPNRVSVPKPAFVQAVPPPAIPTKVTVDKGAKVEADGRLAAAKQRLDAAEAALESRRIIAPRPGKILRILVKSGDTVDTGSSIVLIRFTDSVAPVK